MRPFQPLKGDPRPDYDAIVIGAGIGGLVCANLLARARLRVLLVEQHVRKALEYCDRAYVMHRGRIELSGTAGELVGRLHEIEDRYLTTAVSAEHT